jgi:pantoate--beta-alanine ligase
MGMKLITTAADLAKHTGSVFVPTMGALHDGHASLVRQSRGQATSAQPVVVSIFVNPMQFGPNEDYTRYPRTLDADMALCQEAGADVVFAPAVEEMYPPGGVRVPALPRVATEPGMEDAARPGHFKGVCQVVLRLFELARPAAAVFGEKDWQQLQVVGAMVRAEGLPIRIIPGETVREPDGLAMSSRNRFLTGEDRHRGLALSRGLRACQRASDPDLAEEVLRGVLEEAGVEPDYAVVRDAETLAPRVRGEWVQGRPMRAVVAGRVGSVRLLDNVAWLGQFGT